VVGLGDLHGQLSGGGEHQHAGAVDLALAALVVAALAVTACGNDALQRGQHEGGGLAGAGGRGHAQVGAVHGGRDGLDLHARGLGVAGVGQGLAQLGAQAQIGEGGAAGFGGGVEVGSRGLIALRQVGIDEVTRNVGHVDIQREGSPASAR